MSSKVTRDHHTWTRDTIKNVSGDVTIDLEGDLTIDVAGGQCTIVDDGAADPDLIIKSTADATSSGNLNFVKNKDGGLVGLPGDDGDTLGSISFYGYNDNTLTELTQFGKIKSTIADASNGTESGKLEIQVATKSDTFSGNDIVTGIAIEGSDTNDEVDVTIGAGADSLTTIAGNIDIDGDTITSEGSLTIDSSNHLSLDANSGIFTFLDAGDNDDAFKITVVGGTGATTLETVSAGADGHLTLDSDGDLILDSGTGNFIAKKAGTEFSAANSAYAGMILGYTRLQGDLTNQQIYEIQDAITVEDDTHKVTFKTPPSELVEIEATFTINISSTDTNITCGLSDADASTGYNSIGVEYEYDYLGVTFSDDEADDGVFSCKWVLPAAELAAIGSSNTFWIGFGTGGATKSAWLTYGVRASHGICSAPFIIKATALPAAIYDGT